MTTAASSARPPATAIAWATATELFCEIPCAAGPPYIARYPRTAEGLAQALNVLIAKPERPAPGKPATSTPRSHPAVRKPGPSFTETEREAARAALKKAGII
jgi:hypothetical protein